jgi:hypothetical protein
MQEPHRHDPRRAGKVGHRPPHLESGSRGADRIGRDRTDTRDTGFDDIGNDPSAGVDEAQRMESLHGGGDSGAAGITADGVDCRAGNGGD